MRSVRRRTDACCASSCMKASTPMSMANGVRRRHRPYRRRGPRQRLQRALRAAQRPRFLRGDAVSVSRCPAEGSGHRQERWFAHAPDRGAAAKDLLHQLVHRILGRRPRGGAHAHHAGRRRRATSRQCAHLSVCRHPACPRRVPAIARTRAATGKPERICLGRTRAVGCSRPLGSRRDRAAGEPLSASRG